MKPKKEKHYLDAISKEVRPIELEAMNEEDIFNIPVLPDDINELDFDHN